MKFAEHLASHLTPEWRKQYINYEKMKKILYTVCEKAPSIDDPDSEIRRRYFAQKEEDFFQFCTDELSKINLFFNQKLAEAQTKSRDLNRDIDILQKLAQAKIKKQKEHKKSTSTTVVQRIRQKTSVTMAKASTGSSNGGARKTSRDQEDGTGGQGSSDQIETSSSDRVIHDAQATLEDYHLPKTLRECRSAFAEFYLSLILLQNYQQLNGTGFRKILKKHDKLLQTEKGHHWFVENVQNAPFFINKEVDNLIQNTERIVTEQIEDGNRQAAMKRLRVPPLSEAQSAWTTFRLGFFMGSFLILVFLVILTILIQERPYEPRWVGVRLFRGFFLLFANIFLMGVNMYGWQTSGVNHVLIFEIDPRDHLTYQSLMEISCFFFSIWALCVLGYLHHSVISAPAAIFPLILLAVCVVWLFNPAPYLLKTARYWFIKHIYYCFTVPFHKVTFPDFWLADQMNSLIAFFLDMEYFGCFYLNYVDYKNGMKILIKDSTVHFHWPVDTGVNSTYFYDNHIPHVNESISLAYDQKGIDIHTGADMCITNEYGLRPLISCLPAFIRFLQCLRRYRDSKNRHPHLSNAGKYATTFFIVLFGSLNTYYKSVHGDNAFFYLWVIAYIVSYGYTLVWDIKMDWSLLETNSNRAQHQFLRDDLIYLNVFYYAAMVEDAILRLAWVLNVSLGDAWLAEVDLLMFITAPLEIVRRFIWNFFRLENEHVNNCGQFRATRDIHIAPISRVTDWGDVEKKMDDDDGVSHRGEEFTNLHNKKIKNASRKARLRRRIAQTFKPIGSTMGAVGFGLSGAGGGSTGALISSVSAAGALGVGSDHSSSFANFFAHRKLPPFQGQPQQLIRKRPLFSIESLPPMTHPAITITTGESSSHNKNVHDSSHVATQHSNKNAMTTFKIDEQSAHDPNQRQVDPGTSQHDPSAHHDPIHGHLTHKQGTSRFDLSGSLNKTIDDLYSSTSSGDRISL